MLRIITHSSEETQAVGRDFTKEIKPGAVIALYGNLGAGKTTFVQGFARGLGIKRRIISPTFIIVRTYQVTNHTSWVKSFYHIDLYRVRNEHDLQSIGLQEILQEKNVIVVIEWPEKSGLLLPEKRMNIRFETLGENERKITVERKNRR